MALSTSEHIDSVESWECAQRWLQKCSTDHPDCRSNLHYSPHEYPTRLLDIGRSEAAYIRLCEASELPSNATYMTLSHCWGEQVPTRLLTSNYASFLHRIPSQMLPRTFADVIGITRRFNVQYLWIDSLCIIQDQISDWEKESNRKVLPKNLCAFKDITTSHALLVLSQDPDAIRRPSGENATAMTPSG